MNGRWAIFYRDTAATLETAYVCPRYPGYIAFQNSASALLRDALEAGQSAWVIAETLNQLYRRSRIDRGFATEDAAEGRAAFKEKRQAVFQRR